MNSGNPDNSKKNLRSVTEIPLKYRHIFAQYPNFNEVQSKVFDTILYTDNPVVISAPTGSGKTAIFELAICRLLTKIDKLNFTDDYKIVYVAPVKALCMERFEDWRRKFDSIGLQCLEATGDCEIGDFNNLAQAKVIVTTPEKWDSLTRRWKDFASVMEAVKLFIIDEVHLVNEDVRGPALEAIVSRMKTIQAVKKSANDKDDFVLRFIAASATIPNIEDLAAWLGTGKEAACYYRISESLRPVQLEKHVLGFQLTVQGFRFDMSLNYKLPAVIRKYSHDKPTLIFCSTRKSVEMATKLLSSETSLISLSDNKKLELLQISKSLQEAKLKQLVVKGIAYHHAGLNHQDRSLIEDAFRKSIILILVCTNTLAMGVNFPAHLVIVKSTEIYVCGKMQEYSEGALLQMIGRAGRPQFDRNGVAVIMTQQKNVKKYENLMNGCTPVESHLHKHLAEHLNSEIVLQTVTDLKVAMKWIRSTFLYVRAVKCPVNYGFAAGMKCDAVEKKLEEMCLTQINDLDRFGLIIKDQAFGLTVASTSIGRLMTRFYISFETIKVFRKLQGNESFLEVFNTIIRSREFSEFTLRVNEKKQLNDINNRSIRFPIKGKIKTSENKISCLIQAIFDNITISDISMMQDAQRMVRIGEKLSKCLCEYIHLSENYFGGRVYKTFCNALLIAKCFKSKLWHNTEFVSRQLKNIGAIYSALLVSAGKTTIKSLMEADAKQVNTILGKNPPFGEKLLETISCFPQYNLELKRKGMNTLQVVVRQINANYIYDGKTAVLIVGDADNNLLLYCSKVNQIIFDDGIFERNILIKNEETIFIQANLIDENLVGVDQTEKLILKPDEVDMVVQKKPIKRKVQTKLRVDKSKIAKVVDSKSVNESLADSLMEDDDYFIDLNVDFSNVERADCKLDSTINKWTSNLDTSLTNKNQNDCNKIMSMNANDFKVSSSKLVASPKTKVFVLSSTLIQPNLNSSKMQSKIYSTPDKRTAHKLDCFEHIKRPKIQKTQLINTQDDHKSHLHSFSFATTQESIFDSEETPDMMANLNDEILQKMFRDECEMLPNFVNSQISKIAGEQNVSGLNSQKVLDLCIRKDFDLGRNDEIVGASVSTAENDNWECPELDKKLAVLNEEVEEQIDDRQCEAVLEKQAISFARQIDGYFKRLETKNDLNGEEYLTKNDEDHIEENEIVETDSERNIEIEARNEENKDERNVKIVGKTFSPKRNGSNGLRNFLCLTQTPQRTSTFGNVFRSQNSKSCGPNFKMLIEVDKLGEEILNSSPMETSATMEASNRMTISAPADISTPLETAAAMPTSANMELSAPMETSGPMELSAPMETSTLIARTVPMEISAPMATSGPMELSAPMETSALMTTSVPMEISASMTTSVSMTVAASTATLSPMATSSTILCIAKCYSSINQAVFTTKAKNFNLCQNLLTILNKIFDNLNESSWDKMKLTDISEEDQIVSCKEIESTEQLEFFSHNSRDEELKLNKSKLVESIKEIQNISTTNIQRAEKRKFNTNKSFTKIENSQDKRITQLLLSGLTESPEPPTIKHLYDHPYRMKIPQRNLLNERNPKQTFKHPPLAIKRPVKQNPEVFANRKYSNELNKKFPIEDKSTPAFLSKITNNLLTDWQQISKNGAYVQKATSRPQQSESFSLHKVKVDPIECCSGKIENLWDNGKNKENLIENQLQKPFPSTNRKRTITYTKQSIDELFSGNKASTGPYKWDDQDCESDEEYFLTEFKPIELVRAEINRRNDIFASSFGLNRTKSSNNFCVQPISVDSSRLENNINTDMPMLKNSSYSTSFQPLNKSGIRTSSEFLPKNYPSDFSETSSNNSFTKFGGYDFPANSGNRSIDLAKIAAQPDTFDLTNSLPQTIKWYRSPHGVFNFNERNSSYENIGFDLNK